MEVGPNLHRCILIVFVHSLFVVWYLMVIFVRWDLHRLCWWKNCLSVSPLKNSKMWLTKHKSLNMNVYTFRQRFRFLSRNIILDMQCIKWTCYQPRQSIHQLLSIYKMMYPFCASISFQHMLLKMPQFFVELFFHYEAHMEIREEPYSCGKRKMLVRCMSLILIHLIFVTWNQISGHVCFYGIQMVTCPQTQRYHTNNNLLHHLLVCHLWIINHLLIPMAMFPWILMSICLGHLWFQMMIIPMTLIIQHRMIQCLLRIHLLSHQTTHRHLALILVHNHQIHLHLLHIHLILVHIHQALHIKVLHSTCTTSTPTYTILYTTHYYTSTPTSTS